MKPIKYKILDTVARVLTEHNVRHHINANESGYSQIERNIADAILTTYKVNGLDLQEEKNYTKTLEQAIKEGDLKKIQRIANALKVRDSLMKLTDRVSKMSAYEHIGIQSEEAASFAQGGVRHDSGGIIRKAFNATGEPVLTKAMKRQKQEDKYIEDIVEEKTHTGGWVCNIALACPENIYCENEETYNVLNADVVSQQDLKTVTLYGTIEEMQGYPHRRRKRVSRKIR